MARYVSTTDYIAPNAFCPGGELVRVIILTGVNLHVLLVNETVLT
jgi:hypothetical protein